MSAFALLAPLSLLLAAVPVLAQDGQVADYIVVGGGTSGCALAARLCEYLPEAQVTVLERGEPRTDQQELEVWRETQERLHDSAEHCVCQSCDLLALLLQLKHACAAVSLHRLLHRALQHWHCAMTLLAASLMRAAEVKQTHLTTTGCEICMTFMCHPNVVCRFVRCA